MRAAIRFLRESWPVSVPMALGIALIVAACIKDIRDDINQPTGVIDPGKCPTCGRGR